MFLKKAVFSLETAKNRFWGSQFPFEGKGVSGDKNEYNRFLGKWGLEYFSI